MRLRTHLSDLIMRGWFPWTHVVTCRVRGRDICVAVTTDTERYRARSYATKEPETLDWLDEYLTPESVFYDIGANIGLYSLYAAKREPKAMIVAFEPLWENVEALRENAQLNRCATVVIRDLALSDRPRHVQIIRAYGERGASGTAYPLEAPVTAGESVAQVYATTLDTVAYSSDDVGHNPRVPFPTMLKIDVDGHESQVLEGAVQTLADPRLRTVLVEGTRYHDLGVAPASASGTGTRVWIEAAWSSLSAGGFRLVRTSAWTYVAPDGSSTRNYIFAR